jgi:hypothetical protein
MADVFLSYAREDREQAQRIAQALGAAGYEVFWDVEIPPGLSWADFLQEKLSASKAALVLWTKTSTASQWVREEARLARDRNKLIPAILDNVAPPFGFGEIQAANLSAWRGDQNDPNWRLLIAAIDRAIGASPRPRPAPVEFPRTVVMPPAPPPFAAPASAAVSDASAGAAARRMPRWVWWAGGGVAALFVLGLIGANMEDNPGAGSFAPAALPQAGGGGVQVSDAVKKIIEDAHHAQSEAQAAAREGVAETSRGAQAAMQAQTGAIGYGTLPLNANTYVSGELALLQQGALAAVVVRSPTGVFTGGLQAEPGTGRFVKMVGTNQAPNGAGGVGVTTFNGETGHALGRTQTAAYSIEGYGDGVPGAFDVKGLGVVQFADGTRYEGEFRSLGQDGRIIKQGLGALYDAKGALAQAGRFENDSFAGPN